MSWSLVLKYLKKWWWVGLVAILVLIWWWVSGGDDSKYPPPRFVEAAKARAEKANLVAEIELAKKKGATEAQVEELNFIMELEDGAERRKRLSEKLNALLG